MTRERAINLCHAIDQYLCAGNPIWDTAEIHGAISMAIEALKAQQWIPRSERLPEYDKDVLCYTDAEEFIVGYRVDNWGQDAWITGEFGDGEFDAIAWMPLPEPYTEEKNERT